MNKLNGWDQTQAQMGNVSEQLVPGGHVVKIIGVELTHSKSGTEMMVLRFDIAESGTFDGMFSRIYRARTANGNGLPSWPNAGTYYQLTTDKDGNTNPRFKGLITAVEKSNSGYEWNWDERTLKGKFVGIIFREEEFLANDGQVRTTVKPMACCPANEAADKPAPAKKMLGQQTLNAVQNTPPSGNGFTQVDDDELPF